MADLMTFPNTWEEYERDYGFTDTEEIYTNGARLIPSFRVEQWLEHIAHTAQDCISRQTAIDALADYIHNVDKVYSTGKLSTDDCKDAAHSVLDDLPTAQPQRMKGKWIPHKSKFGGEDEKVYTCDQCGHNIGFHVENFCPNCGAEMTEGKK